MRQLLEYTYFVPQLCHVHKSSNCSFCLITVTSDNITAKLHIAKLLIENGAVTRKSKGQKESVLDVAVKSLIKVKDEEKFQTVLELLGLLLANGADPNSCCEGKDSPLIFALQNGALGIAEHLLRTGAKVDHIGMLNKTPLKVWLDTGKSIHN